MNHHNSIRIEVVPPEGAASFSRRGEPVRVGIPLARGLVADGAAAQLFDAAGRRCLLQTRTLDRWSDGSVRWLLLDFLADHNDRPDTGVYELAVGGPAPDAMRSPLQALIDVGQVSVDTGTTTFLIRKDGRFPFEEVVVAGTAAIDAGGTRFEVTNREGHRCPLRIQGVELEESGPIRAVVRLDGQIGRPGETELLHLMARLHFFAGSATVRIDLTLGNPRRAVHRGGFWELGDPGSVVIRDASLVLSLPAGSEQVEVRCSPEPDMPLELCGDPLELYQDSSGRPNWHSRNHVDSRGSITTTFGGYRFRSPAETRSLHATPVLVLSRGASRLAVAVPQFWQNFPKALEAARDVVTLRLFPRQSANGHEIQGGEQKTHSFFVAFGADRVTETPLAWTRAPLLARATPGHYCDAGAVPYLVPVAKDPNTGYLELVRSAVEGPASFEAKRDVIDEYGWRNFGDLYADHERVYYTGSLMPLISHYNNQYDAVGGFALQFMRSGEPRWWQCMSDLAAHVVDIDLYHTDHDRAAYNHGMFWHSAHYTDAGKSSHRSYPRAPGISGGGPSAEHNYTSGLLLHYFLTGDSRSREAVIELGRWVIDADDGSKTPLRWLSRTDTGYSSATYSASHHGPGRGAGYSINALVDAHQLTGESVFLRKAEALIRRCIHPADDIESRTLLDAERRWSYTVFLYTLGKYLDYKAARNEIDAQYAYAQAALLAYARWMAAHERPYLDQVEQLEFPTETWAAQDMWKSDVFKFAAKHSVGAERAQMLERSELFFRYSTTTLQRMETHRLTRPTVLMLSHGFMHAYFQRNPEAAAPHVGLEFDCGRPSSFVPQKMRAMRLAIACLGVGGVLVVLAALALFGG